MAFFNRAHVLTLSFSSTVACLGKAQVAHPPTDSSEVVNPEPSSGVSVFVREIPRRDAWHVRYEFARPVGSVVFESHRNQFRSSSWTLSNPQLVWGRLGEYEYVARRDRAPMRELKLTFDSDFSYKHKDAELNKSYTDGSRLLFTGHLQVRTTSCSAPPCPRVNVAETTKDTHDWNLETQEDRTIISHETRATGRLEGLQIDPEGTYVYFGSIEPEPVPGMSLVIDPGMPRWMVQDASDVLPSSFAYFADHSEIALDFAPALYLSSGGTEHPGRTLSGGSGPGMIQVAIEGEGWVVADEDTRMQWLTTLAHESFHLWNGEMFGRRLGRWEEWLSEGSAEYFARRYLRDAGLISDRDFAQEVVRAANACTVRLRDRPVLSSHRTGDDRNFYTCGMALIHTLDSAIKKSNPDQDIWHAISRMFASARQSPDHTYSTYTFFEAIETLTGDPISIGLVEMLLRVGVKRGDQFWLNALRNADLDVDLVDIGEAELSSTEHVAALRAGIVRCDCKYGMSVSTRPEGIEFHPMPGCTALQKGATINAVEGVSVMTDPRGAHRELVAAIDRSGSFELTTSTRTPLVVECHDEFSLAYRHLLQLRSNPKTTSQAQLEATGMSE